MLGNIQFIGYLYKNGLLTERCVLNLAGATPAVIVLFCMTLLSRIPCEEGARALDLRHADDIFLHALASGPYSPFLSTAGYFQVCTLC